MGGLDTSKVAQERRIRMMNKQIEAFREMEKNYTEMIGLVQTLSDLVSTQATTIEILMENTAVVQRNQLAIVEELDKKGKIVLEKLNPILIEAANTEILASDEAPTGESEETTKESSDIPEQDADTGLELPGEPSDENKDNVDETET